MKYKKWSIRDLKESVKRSRSVRQTIQCLHLVPAGGNYRQVAEAIRLYNIDTAHFSGKGWRKGSKIPVTPQIPIRDIFNNIAPFQSFKLKKRLFKEGYKKPICELCGWSKRSKDGRIPLELDHVNGNSRDNRLTNLRILCPNCHSLQPTHRGKNKHKAGMV